MAVWQSVLTAFLVGLAVASINMTGLGLLAAGAASFFVALAVTVVIAVLIEWKR